MKRILTLCFFTSFATQAVAQSTHDTTYTNYADSSTHTVHDSTPAMSITQSIFQIFQNLDTSMLSTGILIDRSVPFINYRLHNGDTTDSVSNIYAVRGLISELNMGSVDTNSLPFPLLAVYNDTIANYTSINRVPICGVAATYDQVVPHAVDSNLLSFTGNLLFDVPGRPRSPYLKKSLDVREKLIYIHLQYL